MVKLFTLHKLSGLLAGTLLLLLAVTGFLLDHDNWRFLYTTTFSCCNARLAPYETRLFEGYYISPARPSYRIACGKRGIFESFDDGRNFKKSVSLQCNGLRAGRETLYAATDDGIYFREAGHWKRLALPGSYVNAITLHGEKLLASVDKAELYLLDTATGRILKKGNVRIDPAYLGAPVTLARFVRDLHYGRGLFDGNLSLLINDFGALVLGWLAFSGYLIWWLIHRKKAGRKARFFIKTHATLLAMAAIVPLSILAITGIFLDHAGPLGSFMRSVSIPSSLLPPVYRSLKADIWSVDYDGKTFRIGNRYGVFESEKMSEWKPVNRGFAYRMFRRGEKLYVSGMGAPNRIYEKGSWSPLPHTPHMFKDVTGSDDSPSFFSVHHSGVALPKFEEITLYTLLLTLHDGSFFGAWWVWINDIAAVSLILLLITGTLRWWQREKKRGRKG